MRKVLLVVMFLLIAGVSKAQCVAEVKDAVMDDVFGSVKVMVQYSINGQNVDVDGTPCDSCVVTSGRYDEAQGSIEEIVALNERDREQHCQNLIIGKMSKEKKDEIISKKLIERKKENQKVLDAFALKIKDKKQVDSVEETFKTIKIKVDTDAKITYTDVLSVEPIVISK